MRVLMVAYHFAPDNSSGTHRSVHFARNLQRAGHHVHVLTLPVEALSSVDESLWELFPYPDRVTRVQPATTAGDVLARLKRLGARQRDGAASHAGRAAFAKHEVEAIPAGAGRGFHGRLWTAVLRHIKTWDTYPDHRRGWLRPAVRTGLQVGREHGVDVVFVSGPPWTGMVAAHQIARRLGCPLIADFRDPWTPRSGRSTTRHRTNWHARRAERMERTILEAARLVLFNSPPIHEVTARGFPAADGQRFRLILNGSDAPRREHAEVFPQDGPLWIRHFGSLYHGRSVNPLVQALERSVLNGDLGADDVAVELYGSSDGRQPHPGEARSEAARVTIHRIPTLPYTEALDLMMQSALLLVVQPSRFNRQIPTKLFDYLCTGNPILVMAEEDSATWAVARPYARCVRVDPDDVGGIAAILERLVRERRNGGLAQERASDDTRHLTKEALGQEFVRLVEGVL
jgi:hypothetical protein